MKATKGEQRLNNLQSTMHSLIGTVSLKEREVARVKSTPVFRKPGEKREGSDKQGIDP